MKNSGRYSKMEELDQDKMEVNFAIIFAFLHAVFMLLFYHYHIKIMFYCNIASVCCYIAEFFIIKKKKYALFYNSMTLEIFLHMLLSELTVGGQYYFYLYSYCVITYLYFQILPSKLPRIKNWNTVLWIVLYTLFPVFAAFWDRNIGPLQPEAGGKFLFAMLNVIVTVAFMNYFLRCSCMTLKRSEQELMEKNELLERLSYFDLLTKLGNRRKLYKDFEKNEVYKNNYCVILGDIDNFKKVNDTYGHECGDQVLSETSLIIRQGAAPQGEAYRWGGEEILILLPDSTKEQGTEIARNILEHIRNNVVAYKEDQIKITMTMGIYEGKQEKDLDKSIKQADDRLYQGKMNGKNQVQG